MMTKKYGAIGTKKKWRHTMKKILTIILTICMLASMPCVPVFAANSTPSADTVLRISAQKNL